MASPNLSEIVTTTLRNRSKRLADNVSNNNALLLRLRQRGNNRTFAGGHNITAELEYAENNTFKRYSGFETLNIQPSDVFSAAEYEIKQAAVAVTISGLEQLQNSGPEQMIDLLESRISNAERTMLNNLSADLYSDGTADSGKQITGLQAVVADGGGGTVGGIDSATFPFWQNQVYDFSTQGVTPGPDTIQSAMNTLFLDAARGNDRPDLVVADNKFFRYYWESLQAIQRLQDEKLGAAGFENLKFMGADVVFDGGQDGAAPTEHMYFLNTNFLHFRSHRDRNMNVINGDRFATDQDAMVRLIGWAGNLTCSNRALQGVIVA